MKRDNDLLMGGAKAEPGLAGGNGDIIEYAETHGPIMADPGDFPSLVLLGLYLKKSISLMLDFMGNILKLQYQPVLPSSFLNMKTIYFLKLTQLPQYDDEEPRGCCIRLFI